MLYLLPKNLLRVSGNPEILHTTKLTRAQKKPQKNFLPQALNMVKIGSEIYKYLLSFSQNLQIFGVLIWV